MDRITVKDLEAVIRRINRTVNGSELEPYQTFVAKDGSRSFVQTPNAYVLSGAYGGYSLHRNCDVGADGESHGVHDVFGCGHVPKRDLYDRMQSFLTGTDALHS